MDMVNVRAAAQRLELEIGALPGDPAAVRAAWSQLVAALALGPAAAMRDCPHCGNPGMRDATLCGFCWNKLVPPGRAVRD